MPKRKVKKSGGSKPILKKIEIRLPVQSATNNEDGSANTSTLLHRSIIINESGVHCRTKVLSSNKIQDDSLGSSENVSPSIDSSSDMDNYFDCACGFGECDKGTSVPSKDNAYSPSVQTPEKKFQNKSVQTDGDIDRVHIYYDDMIVASSSLDQHNAILKKVLDDANESTQEKHDKCSTTPTEVPDLSVTERLKVWTAKHKVTHDASIALLKMLKKFQTDLACST